MVRYTPDKIKAKFPHPTLQRVEGEPDYAAANTIMQQLYKKCSHNPIKPGRKSTWTYQTSDGAHTILQPLCYSL
eukprot:5150313-Ditylum_brightwellii.AAC.1